MQAYIGCENLYIFAPALAAYRSEMRVRFGSSVG